MKVLSSSAVFGLVPVPPLPGGENYKDKSPKHCRALHSAEHAPDATQRPVASPLSKWRRVVQRVSVALTSLFAIALTVGPATGNTHTLKVSAPISSVSDGLNAGEVTRLSKGKLLRPVTFGMQPALPTKVAVAVPRDLKPVDIVIDVIVAYTKKAGLNYRNIKLQLVERAIQEANDSFRASNLGHIKLRLVHAYQTDYVEEGSHFDHVWRFADKRDGYMEEIHGLREKYRADVAVLIVDDAKGCGLATRVEADADEAFAVAHHECAATSYTLAHEVGHIIGARHELGYVNGTKWRDIMTYKDACGGCPRLAVWSSPTVLVNGEAAGTVELNNARIIADGAARVAAFR